MRSGDHAGRVIRRGGCGHRARQLGTALLLAIAVAVGGCATTPGQAHRGDDQVAGEGAVWTSSPARAPSGGAVVSGFVVFGDFGGGQAQHAVVTAIGRWVAAGHRVDALVTTGDNDRDRRQRHGARPRHTDP